MEFTPKTRKQLNDESLIPDGTECDFEIIKAANDVSKKTKKDMIVVKAKVFHGEGFKFIDHYLMEAMLKNLLDFCEIGGLQEKYDSGRLTAEDCLGVCGKCKVKVEPEGDYPAKNVISRWIVPKAKVQEPPAKTADSTDDVPWK